MRYVGLVLFLICVPVLAAAIGSSPTIRRRIWVLLGASPFIYGWAHLSVSIVSWAYWPGYVKGLIIALPDLLALSLLFSTRKQPVRLLVIVAFGMYILAAVASMFVSALPFASFLYVWQLLRVFLVAFAVARISVGSDAPRHIVYGLCYGIAFQASFSIFQHLGHDVIQASGTMGHQNLLGMMTHFALFTAVSLILAGDRAVILKVGAAAALITVALTGSRGTLGFASAGVILLIALSLLRRPTAKKMRAAGLGLAVLVFLSPVAYFTLERRFAGSNDGGAYDERAAFDRAAWAMWSDHPLGVGANEYVVTANVKGYSSRAGVIWNSTSRAANVHNAYLLIAAETGWLGLVTFLLLYTGAVLTGVRAAWANPYSVHSELALGTAVALITVGVHNFYEWIFVIESTQYLFGLLLGFTMALGWTRVPRRNPLHLNPEHAPPIDTGVIRRDRSSFFR